MIARYSSLLMVLFLITAAVGPVASAAGQQSQADAGDWVMPRTPDGHPDFQGTWTNVTITPFERPEDQRLTRAKIRAGPTEPTRRDCPGVPALAAAHPCFRKGCVV